jgi:ribA/ribD-fused uncharacterized protein
MNENRRVLFYTSKWYVFDNFSAFSITWAGGVWSTVEHAYQAAKFDDPSIVSSILHATSAHEAKKIAHLPENILKVRSNWDKTKVDSMRQLLRAKLEQHEYVRKKLLETGNLEIIEDSPSDSFWGRGPTWNGKNYLGILWMELRDKLRDSL